MIAEEFDYRLSLMDVAPAFRGMQHLICFDSASVNADAGRYSYLMAKPSLVLSANVAADTNGSHCTSKLLSNSGHGIQSEEFQLDPLEICRVLLHSCPRQLPGENFPPFLGVWAGYAGYDYGAFQLGVTTESVPLRAFPDAMFCWYDWTLAWDHDRKRAWILIRDSVPDGASVMAFARELSAVAGSGGPVHWRAAMSERVLRELRGLIAGVARGAEDVRRPGERRESASGGGTSTQARKVRGESVAKGVTSSFDRESYQRVVTQVRELILAGDIFQANISQRFSAQFDGDAWKLYSRIREESPASFAAFLEFESCAILSASPELFLRVSPNGTVETRPIKGTRPRGVSATEDMMLTADLLSSEKDRSENLMIVDLLRNDLSRVCEPKSVFVPALFEVEKMTTVQHLVSRVVGKLRPDTDVVDAFRACFPGGSITGAPKTRATQVISAIEGAGRGVYCGSIGYFAAEGAAQFNIAIRTLSFAAGAVSFAAGGGIVLDSVPEAEYEETLNKAAGIFSAIGESAVT